MPQAVAGDSLIYADDTCIVFQYKNVTKLKSITGLLIVNLVYISANKKQNHFYLALNTMKQWKLKKQNAKALNNVYNGKEIKQYEKVKYFGCTLDQSLSRDSMAFNIIDKVNSCLKFLHR